MSEWKIRFGTAGTSDSFTAMGYKNSLDIPAYTEKMGLDAFEYQCGHGVRLGLDKARQMADDAAARGILFSVHAPYYISASSLDEEKRLNSVNYLLQSAALCRALGGRRVIFHSGSCGRQSREAALEKALDTLKRAQDALDEAGFAEITLCPETMGKIGQLGTLEEVLALCGVDRRITPCIDFGHLNARTLGGIRSKADYAAILDRIGEALGLSAQARRQALAGSLLLSADNGHAVHPNFPEKADPANRVYPNGGVVIKYSANQKYTTTGLTAGLFQAICQKAGVPVQVFANRADEPGGSTLGNLLGHQVSIPMVDIGMAQLAMHSAVETAGSRDPEYMARACAAFFQAEFTQTADGVYQF